MKNKALLIVLLLITSTLFAQQKPFQFGFKGGLNLGWMATDAQGYNREGSNFGGSWGFTSDFFIMDNYSFTTGFDVLYLNGMISYPDYNKNEALSIMEIGKTTRKYKTKYVELPLIFTMKTNEIGKVKYFAQIGFGISFLLSAKANDDFISEDGIPIKFEDLNVYDDLRFTRESLIVGAGVEIPIQESTYFRLGLKIDNAFANVIKGYNKTDSYLKNNGRNSFAELNVSVFF